MTAVASCVQVTTATLLDLRETHDVQIDLTGLDQVSRELADLVAAHNGMPSRLEGDDPFREVRTALAGARGDAILRPRPEGTDTLLGGGSHLMLGPRGLLIPLPARSGGLPQSVTVLLHATAELMGSNSVLQPVDARYELRYFAGPDGPEGHDIRYIVVPGGVIVPGAVDVTRRVPASDAGPAQAPIMSARPGRAGKRVQWADEADGSLGEHPGPGSDEADAATSPAAVQELIAVNPLVRSIGVPRTGLPAMARLIQAVRDALGEAGHRAPEHELIGLVPRLVANYPYLLGDIGTGTGGLQMLVGPVELLITLDPVGPRRVHWPVPDPARATSDPRAVETINATYATGAHAQTYNGQTHAQTHTGQTNASRAGLDLTFGIGVTPNILQVFRAGVAVSGTANRSDRSISRVADAETGHVEDTRAESALLSYTPNWSVRFRTDPGRRWADIPLTSPVGLGPERLLLWVPEHYLRQAPPEQLVATGSQVRTARLPEMYFASGLTGLPALFDEIATTLRARGLHLPIGGATRAELLDKVGNLNAHLDEAVNDPERGYTITLHDEHGRPVATVTIRSERIGDAVRVGETSQAAHLENGRTAIDGGGGTHTITNSTTVTPFSIEFDLLPNPMKIHDLGLGVSTYATYTSTNINGISAGRTGLWVMVPRYRGYTTAYEVGLRHRATVNVRGGREDAPRTAGPVEDLALIRMSEPDAYEHGFPVDREALKNPPAEGGTMPFSGGDPVRNTGRGPHDPVLKPLPPHVAAGKGVGMGIVHVAPSTVREMRARLKEELRTRGFLPADEDDPFAGHHWYGHGNDLDSRIDNLALLEKMVSSAGLDSHYDQVHQDGMIFTLRRRSGGAGIDANVDSARITIRAKMSRGHPPTFIRSTGEYHTVNLSIGLDTAGQSVGHSRKLAWGVRFSSLFRLLRTASTTVELQRTVGASDAVNFVNSRPELLEYPGEVDEFTLTSDYEIRIEYQHSGVRGGIRPNSRDPDPIVMTGQAALARLLPLGNDRQEGPTSKRPTPASVLDQAVIYYLDTTGARDAAATALTGLTGPAAAADLDISAFASTIQLRAHLKEILTGEYTTDQPFASGGLRDVLGAINISGKLGRSTFTGATKDSFVVGIIKLWLAQSSLTDTSSNGLTWDQLDAGFGGGAIAGEFDVSRRWQDNRSRASGRTGGKELIQLAFSRVYSYRSDVYFDIRSRQEKHGKLVPASARHHPVHLEPRTVMYLLPEPEALAGYADGILPVTGEQLADAVDRWRQTKLEISGNVMANVLLRWREEEPAMPEVLRPLLDDHPGRVQSRGRDDWDRLAGALAPRLQEGRTPLQDHLVHERFNSRFGQPLAGPNDPYGHVDTPSDLLGYATGTGTVPTDRLVDAMTLWSRGMLRLTGDVAAQILMRWHKEALELPDGLRADRDALVLTLFRLHRSGGAPVRSLVIRERLNEMFAAPGGARGLEPLAGALVPLAHMELPEYLTRRSPGGAIFGHSGIRNLAHDNNMSTYQIVSEQIAKVAPGMLAAGAAIWDSRGRVIGRMQGGVDALQSLLARGRDQAIWEDVLARDGYRFYLVNPVGWLFSDVVEVGLADVLTSGPHVHDFRPESGLENYGHSYTSASASKSRDGSQSFTFAKLDPTGPNAGGFADLRVYEGHHRGTTRAETAVTEQTVYDWSGHYLARFERELTVTVRRLAMPGRPLNNLLAGLFSRWTGHGATAGISVPGSLELQVPRALAEAGTPRGPVALRDLTPLPKLPANAYVSGVLLDDALPAGRELMARIFGPGRIERLFGARASEVGTQPGLSLPVLLSRSHLTNHLKDAAGGQSEVARNLFIPGDSSRRATMWLSGDLYGAEIIGVMDSGTGTGRYSKHQSGTTTSSSTDHGRLQADASAAGFGTIGHSPGTWNQSSSAARLTASTQAEAAAENYRREQHVKELGRTLLIRMSGRFWLIAQRSRHHLFRGPALDGVPVRSDPITGDVYVEMFESQYEEWRTQAATERAAAQQAQRDGVDRSAWPVLGTAPTFELTALLADAARHGFDVSNAHQSVVRHIRRESKSGQPLVLRAGPENAVRRYRAVLEGAVRTIERDLRVAREIGPVPDPPELRRYRHHLRVRADTLLASLPRPVDDEITDMINVVNRVHGLRPDNPLGTPAALPPEVSLLALDPVVLARNVAHDLNTRVQVNITGPGGRVLRRWIGPDGRVHAFNPQTFGDVALSADAAMNAGLLSPDLHAEVKAFGLDDLELGRIYRFSWDRQQTFGQAVTAEIAVRRERLRAQNPDWPAGFDRLTRDAEHWRAKIRQLETQHAEVTRKITSTRQALDERLRRELDNLYTERHQLGSEDPGAVAAVSSRIWQLRAEQARLEADHALQSQQEQNFASALTRARNSGRSTTKQLARLAAIAAQAGEPVRRAKSDNAPGGRSGLRRNGGDSRPGR